MAKRGRPADPPLPWFRDVAKLMVRENLGFSQACQALGIKFESGKVEENIQNRKSWQEVIWRERNEYYEEIGGHPDLTKNVVMGVLANSIKHLEEKGEHDKVATAAYTLAKIAGWLQPEVPSTVFANLSQVDIDTIKSNIKAKMGYDLEVPPPPVEIKKLN